MKERIVLIFCGCCLPSCSQVTFAIMPDDWRTKNWGELNSIKFDSGLAADNLTISQGIGEEDADRLRTENTEWRIAA